MPLPQGAFGLVTVFGNPNTKVEQLRDFETGYRAQINRRLSLDVTGFLSFYQNLETTEPLAPYFALTGGFPHLVIPLIYDYKAHARNYGAEAFANWNVTDRWKTQPRLDHAEYVRQSRSVEPGFDHRADARVLSQAELSGALLYQSGAQLRVGPDRRLYRSIGHRKYPWLCPAGHTIRMADRRVLELSIVGQNLLQPRHAEFPDFHIIDHMLDQRSVFGKITWRF